MLEIHRRCLINAQYIIYLVIFVIYNYHFYGHSFLFFLSEFVGAQFGGFIQFMFKVCIQSSICKSNSYSFKNMDKTLTRFKEWAYNHSDEAHPKYNTISHSLLITIMSTLIFVSLSLFIRYTFFPESSHQLQPISPYVGIFLQVYLFVMIGSRFLESGCIALYESLWACNQCILLAGIGCLTDDAFLIRTILIVVSVDQLLWYVDLTGFLIKRKFYVGVAKYIVWPETTKIRLATTYHHIWFLPLCLWLIHPTAKYETLGLSNYVLSCIWCQILVIIGRISTPKHIIIKNEDKEKEKTTYMNLNLSWELWKDLKMGFLKHFYNNLPPQALIFVIPMVWDVGNLSGFILFWAIETLSR